MRRVDQTPKQLAERIKSREEEATCSQGLGSRATAVYRAHLINTDDHIQASKVIKAESDESALEIAKQYVDGCDVELWDRDRKIARVIGKHWAMLTRR